MAKYKYNARTKEGELQTGFVEAPSRDLATNTLTGHELFILSMEEAETVKWYEKFLGFLNRVKLKDLMVFTRQFATLLESKVPLGDSIRSLYKQTKNPILKEAVFEVSTDIDSGLSLSQALERQSAVFSEFYVNMIRSAEITGRLEEAMLFLAEYLDKEVMWHSRIRNALIYPITVIILFVVVAGIMLMTVFPQIEPIFKESGIQLPFITEVLLGAGSFMLKWWWSIFFIIALVIVLLVDYVESDEGKAVANEIVIKIPVMGNLFKKIYVARFAEAVSVLIRGAIPLAQAVEIAGHSIQNLVYRDVLHEVAEGIKAGELFSSLLAQNEYYFPPLVSQMVAIGEGAGRLDEVLTRISTLYTREVNDILDNLVEMIQPALIAVIGIFVGLLFASILIPIYNLAQTF